MNDISDEAGAVPALRPPDMAELAEQLVSPSGGGRGTQRPSPCMPR